MNNKQQAVVEIKKLGKLFKGLIELSEQLEQAGSVEAAVDQAKETLRQKRAEHDELEMVVAGHRQALKDLVEENASQVRLHQAQCREMLEKAELERDGIIIAAKDEATKIKARANAAAERLASDTKKDLADTDAALAAGTSELAKMSQDIADAQERYDGINAALAKLRERL